MVTTFHTGRERNCGFPKTVTQFVGGGKGPRPALLRLRMQQVELPLLMIEARSVNAQEPDLGTQLPIVPEKLADFRKNFVVQLGAGSAGERALVMVWKSLVRSFSCKVRANRPWSRRRRPTCWERWESVASS